MKPIEVYKCYRLTIHNTQKEYGILNTGPKKLVNSGLGKIRRMNSTNKF